MARPFYYKLDGHEVVPAADQEDYALSRGDHCVVGGTRVSPFTVSTIFLGVNMGMFEPCPPVVFETMVFLGEDLSAVYQRRCSTWQQAVDMHNEAVRWAAEQNREAQAQVDAVLRRR